MRSRLYIGEVTHARFSPVKHAFRYPIWFGAFDLDELPALARNTRLFGHNRRGLMALFDADYLDERPGTIRDKLAATIATHSSACSLDRVTLVTAPRLWRRVFNPVSFYYCMDSADRLECVVAEVNNTFGERHVYFLNDALKPRPGFLGRYVAPKTFHVSPFFSVAGEYEFHVSHLGPTLDIRVNLSQDGRPAIATRLFGRAKSLDATTMLKIAVIRPFSLAVTMPRILLQAGKLYYRKGLAVHSKPAAISVNTIRVAQPTTRQRFAQGVILKFLQGMKIGRLTLRLPDRTERGFGDTSSSDCVLLDVRNYDFFPKVLKAGDIGFGESYTGGDWDCEQLTDLIRLFVANQESLNDANIRWTSLGRMLNGIRHAFRGNNRSNSRRNIQAHYDLGNDFYRLFLDPRMIYSSGIFEHPNESLEAAQGHKLDRVLRLARLDEGDHVLEIGSGWGALAIEAAKRFRCRVTGITLSKEQLVESRKRAAEAGVADRVHFELCDYRDVRGRFDRIVSIEMLEAVGHKFFGKFFATCDRLLEPDGLVVLQSITIPDQRYESYRKSSDWINKHIFPGGHLPSLTALTAAITKHSNFVVEELLNIGPHYATTLQAWRERFNANAEQLSAQGFDREFQRKWNYYFAYCEAAFQTRTINNLQIVLSRPGNRRL